MSAIQSNQIFIVSGTANVPTATSFNASSNSASDAQPQNARQRRFKVSFLSEHLQLSNYLTRSFAKCFLHSLKINLRVR